MMTEAELLADLLSRGYVPIADSPVPEVQASLTARGLIAGARVCNEGQKWPEARSAGTAVVLEVFHKPHSSWEQSYGRPDVEVLIERDKDVFGAKFSLWQDYGTHVAYDQTSGPAESR